MRTKKIIKEQEDPYLKSCFEEEQKLFDRPYRPFNNRRQAQRLRSFTDRYAKVSADIKERKALQEKIGVLLQEEMERQGVKRAEGTTVIITLSSGERLTEISSIKFYEAVPEQLRPKAWDALSVLVEKARKLVGEDILRDLGKSVPFTRLIMKRKNGGGEEAE